MKALMKVAAFVQSRDLDFMPAERLDRIKRHVIDTWGAQVAGSRVDEGIAVEQLVVESVGKLSAIVLRCARARCTELDDVHLTSCTTPGAVVVATAIALASARAAAGKPVSNRHFCAAALAGYETLIRLGFAIDGPFALHAGIWPTAFAAAFGSAATASRLFGLSVTQTGSALATSLAFAQHEAVESAPPGSSRWFSLGLAAASGVMAAYSARRGMTGRMEIRGRSDRLIRGLGRQYLFDAIGMKPYPTARQALAAIEAVRDVVRAERLSPSQIDRIIVDLPTRQRAIVDRSGFPASRFDSIVNVRYQIALALVAPERLSDVVRTPLFDTGEIRRLMTKTEVRRARDLDKRYPRSWPARVEVTAAGRRRTRVVLHPYGDACQPLGWGDVSAKLRAIAAPVVGADAVERLVNSWRDLDIDASLPAFP